MIYNNNNNNNNYDLHANFTSGVSAYTDAALTLWVINANSPK